MKIDNEVKGRFVELLAANEIIAVGRRISNKAWNMEWKVIGSHNGLHWDFTPMLIELTDNKRFFGTFGDGWCIRNNYIKDVVADALSVINKDDNMDAATRNLAANRSLLSMVTMYYI